ncbi:MAG: cholesterol oxidase [Verrucomicrobiales bacterium]|jgi:cholesterol oxidase
MARAGRSVCLFERGRELLPGEYPNEADEALKEVHIEGPGFRQGRIDGLYDFRVNPEVNIFMGCGLGGTSLVNANVSMKPEDRVLDDPIWPVELKQDQALTEGYQRAEAMLQPVRIPHLPTKTAMHQ